MPQIIVTADTTTDGDERAVMFTERVSVDDFESPHFQSQLVERLGWAVGDAQDAESSSSRGQRPTDTTTLNLRQRAARVVTTAS